MVQEGELAVDTITQVKPVYNSFAPEAFAQDIQAQGESVASDSLAQEAEPVYGLLLTAPEAPPQAPSRTGGGEGVSFILCGLFVIFLIIALRFRNNYKYVLAMLRGLVETKTRHNVFDDTVNESSMIVLLNILWCACTGIILFSIYYFFNPVAEVWEHRAVG
ncbi:MAG: DUF4271 domain-containing protein, partial [Muribaculaceae bacterium]|nr:DUF4271 domain-containing protein [Muribaculaceae bacterium]